MDLSKMYEARVRAVGALRAHLDSCEMDKRAMSGEEKSKLAAIEADLADLDARIAAAEGLAKREANAAVTAEQFPVKSAAVVATPSDNDVLRRMISGEQRGGYTFAPEARDLLKGGATTGGNTVPTSFYGRLQEHLIVNAGMLRTNVTVLNTASGETIQVPKTTAHSTAAWIAEAGSITESDPAFGQVSLGAYKLGLSIDVATELEQDTAVDLMGYLARQGGQALGNLAGAAYVVGDGSSKPTGIVGSSTLGVTGAASVAGAFDADKLIDLFYSVTEPYRINGYWMLNDSTLAAVRKLKDSGGRYIFEVEGGSGNAPAVGKILGRPVVTDPNMAAVALGAKSVLFGDMSTYFVRNVTGIRVERSEHLNFRNDLVTWRFLMRTEGKLVDTTGAVKHFIGNAA